LKQPFKHGESAFAPQSLYADRLGDFGIREGGGRSLAGDSRTQDGRQADGV
jgi:hypothetical protein